MDWEGKRICALGLGRFGGQLAAIEYLARAGADILVTDSGDPASLRDSLDRLADYPQVRVQFRPQVEDDVQDCDAVLVSPAILPRHPCVQAAIAQKIPLLTEVGLFLEACPARVIAISGTVGKSTTGAMLTHILRAGGLGVHFGGNIGSSLLLKLAEIHNEDFVVLELSSFQLHYLQAQSPRFIAAALTNLSPHHLEWHVSFENYRDAKAGLFAAQTRNDAAILPREVSGREWPGEATRIYFSQVHFPEVPEHWPEHDCRNAAAALSIADWLGVDVAASRRALHSYRGLPHRLQRLPNSLQRIVINDSKATSPMATQAALQSLTGPGWLVLGGAKSADDTDELLQSIVRCPHLRGVACMGPAGETLIEDLHELSPQLQLGEAETLGEAWDWCWRHSADGDTLLLSPGFPSFNEFMHYEARGDCWEQLLRETEDEHRQA
ncbi:Mur ligase family protein [Rubinisphaera margarita]|uniref:Mur ligase family protein n=1 Tax=Rubinisphaera margarita TaxID=2909586 RepID=UPI001EE8B696|nr:UDP-N-acetylmuramoyl-L-alanine--D-glutamate ligase [Rubinisphaera margarita]MCG6155030.1 UDP-N-acetylmuramoyl-L-alanine--D-glutamate ligase [Rubinisphaera margarita]